MTTPEPVEVTRALSVPKRHQRSDSHLARGSVRSDRDKRWIPPEGLMPDQIRAVIAAVARTFASA